MATSWVSELDKKEHKNWVMVGCALNIAKNGISQLIQGKMEAWYQSLISSPPLQSLAPCTCVPGSPTWCGTCTTWKTELKRHHKFNQPKILNSDRTQWGSVTGAWEIAKVFMSALGSRKTQVVDAETTDVGGLLNLLEQCPFIQPPVNPTVLSSARDQCRNHWAHAPKQELQDADVNSIFGHLNNLLNDPIFLADSSAQQSSKELQDLRNNGLVNVRDSEVEALHLLRQSLVTDLVKCQEDLAEVQDKVVQLDAETKKVDTAVQKVREQGNLNREDIAKQSQQLETKIKEVEANLSEKISTILLATDEFNKLVDERDDLREKFDLVSNDFEDVRYCFRSIDLKHTATESELANFKIKVSETISSLQMDVIVMKNEVETLKINASQEQNGEDSDAPFAAPRRLAAFTGREAALQWLEQNLAPGQRSENCPEMCCHTKAICGLGGCGKTSLAVEFSWRYKNRFPGGVFWINGESDENICKSVAENLALLDIPSSTSEKVEDTLNRFLVRLSKKKRPWLLLVDNADDLEDQTCPAGVKKICRGPWQTNGNASKMGNILLPTRRGAKDTKTFLKFSGADDCFQLQCFSEMEGALFLMQKTGCEVGFLDPNAVLLAKELGSLPLALEQAAAYISAFTIPCSFKAYLEKYQDAKLRLLKQQPATALSVEAQHRLSVHTTWQINFEFVKEKSPAAATMMHIAAFLESDNVPIDVINPGFPELDQEELRNSVRSEIDVDAVLKVLSSYSLLSVDQKRRVFAIHKLVQEVVKESLTAQARTEILKAASRVLHFAFKANNERDSFIRLMLSFRTLKNHMKEQSKLLKEDSLHALYNIETLELCNFVFKFPTEVISFFWVSTELLEFKLRVLRVVYSDVDQPDLFLSTMVETSTSKLARSAPLIDKEAKKLSDNAVKKLIELEESGVRVSADVKFEVLNLSTSFHAMENQWKENYKALLELEELPITVNKFVELQQNIARVEYLSSRNAQPALRRYQNTLKIAREAYPSNEFHIVGLLMAINDLLFETGKVEEAKPYADELLELCKKQSPTSDRYIFGVSAAMKVKCYFDPQASDNTLVDILKRNWPHIYRIAASVSQPEISEEEITIGDGTEKILSAFLNLMLECIFVIYARKAGEDNFPTSKLKFYRTIAYIKLCLDKSRFGEIRPAMKEAYMCQHYLHLILGNKTEALRFQELVDKCQQLAPGQNKSVNQTLPFNANLIHTSMYKNSANVLFKKGNYSGALELYNQALSLSPNDAKLLTNKAMTCVKLSEQSSLELDKHRFLEQALRLSQNAVTVDPSWVKGYYWKAVCLAHLGKRGPSLAAAAVAKHLFPSQCAKIPAVLDRYGSYDVQFVTTGLELRHATERSDTQNLVIVVKEGRYELQSPLNIPNKNAVIVGLGEVQISCSKGIPLQLEESAYMENISLYPTLEILKERAKKCVINGQVDEALSLNSQALISRPNNPQILTSRALCYLKSAELKKDNPSEKKSVLVLGLNDAEAAIKADPAWLLGYHTKAAILAELDRKRQALAAAAVFKHLSSGRDVPGVTQRYGDLQILVVQSSDELCSVPERIKKLEGVNQVVLIKEGEYQCERSIAIPQQIVVVGQGKVTVSCKNGAPFRDRETFYVENVEIIADCDNEDKLQQQDLFS